jgi:3D-(3,5/4)-trihydroxycyclohexane-1,2-dione acylhydrolase (decyclizing)
VPEVSTRAAVRDARAKYDAQLAARDHPDGPASDAARDAAHDD